MKHGIVAKMAIVAVLLAAAMNVAQAVDSGWYFATSDAKGERHVFGPYATKLQCMQARNFEANTDRWRLVGTCEKH